MDESTLGARIKELRERRRLTQPDLALALNVSSKTISNWENGHHVPRNSLGALRAFFGAELDALEGSIDPVEAAIRASALEPWRQNTVVGVYQKNLADQQREQAG